MIKDVPFQFSFSVSLISMIASGSLLSCQKRNYNEGRVESVTASGPLKTYSCNPKAKIIPMGSPSPTGVADFKQFKFSLDSSTSPFSARVEKLGSFKEWLAVTAGKTDQSELAPHVITGSLKSVVLTPFLVGFRYVITLDTGADGDATFAIFAGRSIKSDKFAVGSVMVEEKDWGIAPGYSSLGGTLGECNASTVSDDGVQGLLNSIAVDRTGARVAGSSGAAAGGSSGPSSAKTCTVTGWISRSETDCAGISGSCGAAVVVHGSGGSTNVRKSEGTTSELVKTLENGLQVNIKGQNATGARLNIDVQLSGTACL